MTQTSAPATRSDRVDFGYPATRLRGPGYAVRVPVRLAVVSAALLAVAVLADVVAIRFGDFDLSLSEVIRVLTGRGEEFHRQLVIEWRLPVAVAALVFGILLGIGGAIFQSLTRNPLGSPDIIGFDAGSFTAVTITILILGSSGTVPLAVASLAGGLAAAVVVYLLAQQHGSVAGFRLIVVGIAVAALLGSLNSYLITRAESTDAVVVGFWGAGSLARVGWSTVALSTAVGLVIVGAAAVLSAPLRRLELGDDSAVALGVSTTRVRLALIVVGVACTSVVTAAAGPIGFVALAAPQLARRLTRTPGVSLVAAAAMGAALLSVAHLSSLLLAQWYKAVPVGLITVCVGGLYLIALLVREARRHYGVPR